MQEVPGRKRVGHQTRHHFTLSARTNRHFWGGADKSEHPDPHLSG